MGLKQIKIADDTAYELERLFPNMTMKERVRMLIEHEKIYRIWMSQMRKMIVEDRKRFWV